MRTSLPQQAFHFLQDHQSRIPNTPTLVGLDGFVDTILHVVDKRLSATEFTRISRMQDYADRISQAAGLSANFEFVTERIKLGGNGPIISHALLQFGFPLTYIGCLGHPTIHPVFQDFEKQAHVISVAEPGLTDAIEFNDGKLMCGKHDSLRQLSWERILEAIPLPALIQQCQKSSLIALMNWTMLPHCSSIFEHFLTEVLPHLEHRPHIFFDLADPAKRTREDLRDVLHLIKKFQSRCKTTLGVNFNESLQIGNVLGLPAIKAEPEEVMQYAEKIRELLEIETVVVHPTRFAAAATSASSNGDPAPTSAWASGAFTESPKIATGAGDHFNSGFCLGQLLDAPLPICLQLGVSTSGFYVRHAHSPTIQELLEFLDQTKTLNSPS